MAKELTFGYSPCPNDTFMFNAIAHGAVGVDGYKMQPVLHDVETLNGMAMDALLDVTKLSFYAWLKAKDRYRLLDSGAAMGFGCGPVLIARKPLSQPRFIAAGWCCPAAGPPPTFYFVCGPRMPINVFYRLRSHLSTIGFGAGRLRGDHSRKPLYLRSAGFKPVVDLGAWWEEKTGSAYPLGRDCRQEKPGRPADPEDRSGCQ
jgi:1,4-dihydroxy-6-naphthoate synthase